MIKRDIFESVIDVGSGFFIAVIIQLTIFPLFDLHPTIFDSFGIAIIFTVVSMVIEKGNSINLNILYDPEIFFPLLALGVMVIVTNFLKKKYYKK